MTISHGVRSKRDSHTRTTRENANSMFQLYRKEKTEDAKGTKRPTPIGNNRTIQHQRHEGIAHSKKRNEKWRTMRGCPWEERNGHCGERYAVGDRWISNHHEPGSSALGEASGTTRGEARTRSKAPLAWCWRARRRRVTARRWISMRQWRGGHR